MGILTIAVGVFGIVGGICGVWSLIYVRKQTAMMAQDISDRKRQDAEDDAWALRLEKLVNQLRHINPNLMVQDPNKGLIQVYPTIFQDVKFRELLETYVVQLNASKTLFLPRSPQAYELRSPTMRETISKAEVLFEKFRKEYPGSAHHLG